MNENKPLHTPEEIEMICRKLDTLKEPVPPDDAETLVKIIEARLKCVNPKDPEDVAAAVEFIRHPFGKPKSTEEINAIRASLLEPWHTKFLRWGLWAAGIAFVIFVFSNFSFRRDDQWLEFQRKAEERDKLVNAFVAGDRAEMFRLANEYFQADAVEMSKHMTK